MRHGLRIMKENLEQIETHKLKEMRQKFEHNETKFRV